MLEKAGRDCILPVAPRRDQLVDELAEGRCPAFRRRLEIPGDPRSQALDDLVVAGEIVSLDFAGKGWEQLAERRGECGGGIHAHHDAKRSIDTVTPYSTENVSREGSL
ncbi:MAG TPA: hypothetical protein VGK89_10300 [Candidatus Eisenbacteria bacterium]